MKIKWYHFLFIVLIGFVSAEIMCSSPSRAETAKPSIHSSLIRPEQEDWFTAYPAAHRIIHGQDPVEPEGNPTHDPDKMECSNVSKEGKMISCSCHKWRTCDEDPNMEKKSCQNYCWHNKCRCKTTCE